MPPLSLSLTRPSHPPPTRWSESRELLQHLDEALNADDPAMLTEAIKRGLRQVPPLQHGTMEEAKTALVETHKRELPPLLTPALRERLWECKVRGCARWVVSAEIGLCRDDVHAPALPHPPHADTEP